MNAFKILLLGALVTGSAAHGSERHSTGTSDFPLIVKSNSSGFTSPDYAHAELCEVYQDRVVISRFFGISPNDPGPEDTYSVREIVPITITEKIVAAIGEAAKADLQSRDNNLCDGPMTHTQAFLNDQARTGVVLFSTGGCGSPTRTRQGGAAAGLMSVVDAYCPTTHQPPMNH